MPVHNALVLPVDRCWVITIPCSGEALLYEYNNEITGYSDILGWCNEVFDGHVYYGGNANYVLGLAQKAGFAVRER